MSKFDEMMKRDQDDHDMFMKELEALNKELEEKGNEKMTETFRLSTVTLPYMDPLERCITRLGYLESEHREIIREKDALIEEAKEVLKDKKGSWWVLRTKLSPMFKNLTKERIVQIEEIGFSGSLNVIDPFRPITHRGEFLRDIDYVEADDILSMREVTRKEIEQIKKHIEEVCSTLDRNDDEDMEVEDDQGPADQEAVASE